MCVISEQDNTCHIEEGTCPRLGGPGGLGGPDRLAGRAGWPGRLAGPGQTDRLGGRRPPPPPEGPRYPRYSRSSPLTGAGGEPPHTRWGAAPLALSRTRHIRQRLYSGAKNDTD
eukprot:gene15147-biopygen20161